ncbi:MAG: stage III sporulation protein AA [Ruminococcus sp.]|nr:stage III sporulation protein AA [Ruminococcus sp.]MBR2304448.1 stage III sporulation protein AA [Ruminococcus sp.]
MKETSRLESVYELLSEPIVRALEAVAASERPSICEIRLRRGRRLSISAFSKEYFVSPDGRLVNDETSGVPVTAEDIDTVFHRAMKGSVHSFRREITEGYVTVRGGCRVGFCGTAVISPEKGYITDNVKEISSVNIRIAREIKGCASDLYAKAFSEGLKGLLIAGPPASGKTTILRDLTRQLGSNYRVSLIDERNELAASVDGIPQNDVGSRTDVFSAYDKYSGIMTAVRVMSPQVLVCDEIGSESDLEALRYALGSGVCIVASCHAPSFAELKKKQYISKLIKAGAFGACAVLGTGPLCGKLVSYSLIGEKPC